MFSRVIPLVALVALLGCGKSPTSKRSESSLPTPPDGPCASDAECKLYLEPCSCGCFARIGEPQKTPDEKWSTMCGGGPPGNCGVASPCMNKKAVCDPTAKKCVVQR